MTFDEIDAVLTGECGLLPDLLEKGNGCSYFLGVIDKSPATTTRIIRVHHDSGENVTQVKRSVSSDINNSVFVQHPLTAEAIRSAVAEEVEMFRARSNDAR